MRRLLLASVWLCLTAASTGCVRTDFEPSRGAPHGEQSQLTERCVLTAEAQLELLVQAGGVVLGTLEVEGAPAAGFERVHDKAGDEAAERGASHVLLLKTWTNEPQRIANMKQVQVNEADDGPKYGRYLVVRVKPARWGELPDNLRPVPLAAWKKEVAASVAAHHGQPAPKPTTAVAIAAAAAPAGPSGPAPTGALGFVFGAAPGELQTYCESLQGKYSLVRAEQATCTGSFEAGIEARASSVELTLCGTRLCEVAVIFAGAAEGAADAVHRRLLEKNGPTTSTNAAGSSWVWSAGETVGLAAAADSVTVTYSSVEGVRQKHAQGL